jgi:hypothetical protein
MPLYVPSSRRTPRPGWSKDTPTPSFPLPVLPTSELSSPGAQALASRSRAEQAATKRNSGTGTVFPPQVITSEAHVGIPGRFGALAEPPHLVLRDAIVNHPTCWREI